MRINLQVTLKNLMMRRLISQLLKKNSWTRHFQLKKFEFSKADTQPLWDSLTKERKKIAGMWRSLFGLSKEENTLTTLSLITIFDEILKDTTHSSEHYRIDEHTSSFSFSLDYSYWLFNWFANVSFTFSEISYISLALWLSKSTVSIS